MCCPLRGSWQAQVHVMQGLLEALVKFMLNLEHLAVLLALCNTKKSAQTLPWRKQRYGEVIALLDSHLQQYESFVKQVDQVITKMWVSLPGLVTAKLHHGSAVQRLDLMHLYVDNNKADETREELAECGIGQEISNAEADAAAEMAAEAEAEAEAEAAAAAEADDAAEEDTQTDDKAVDQDHRQLSGSGASAAAHSSGAHAAHKSERPGIQLHSDARSVIALLSPDLHLCCMMHPGFCR